MLALELTHGAAKILGQRAMGRARVGGQVAKGDEVAAAEDHGPFEDVLELADVAPPRPADERPERVSLDAEASHAEPGVEPVDEVIDQDRDIAASLAQRRHREVHDVQPDRKSTRLNSSHGYISYAVFC